jgi:hypothetical protein
VLDGPRLTFPSRSVARLPPASSLDADDLLCLGSFVFSFFLSFPFSSSSVSIVLFPN